jgi:predicted transcriptional regulator of viral defense system
MTIREWIKNKEIAGTSHFSVEEVQHAFANAPQQQIKNELYRLSSQRVIKSIYRGFYVIVPVQYAAKGEIPSLYYIDQLMSYIGKPYYISLLNAAELLGCAHQRPQQFYVTTIQPYATTSKSKNATLYWVYRKDIPESFLLTKNSETGTIRYSNAELTAIDIVQYTSHIGGLSRTATLLSELAEITDYENKIEELLQFTTTATLQRLGYLLDEILEEPEQAGVIYKQLIALNKRMVYVPLSNQREESGEKNKKWKIDINAEIEVDDV